MPSYRVGPESVNSHLSAKHSRQAGPRFEFRPAAFVVVLPRTTGLGRLFPAPHHDTEDDDKKNSRKYPNHRNAVHCISFLLENFVAACLFNK